MTYESVRGYVFHVANQKLQMVKPTLWIWDVLIRVMVGRKGSRECAVCAKGGDIKHVGVRVMKEISML